MVFLYPKFFTSFVGFEIDFLVFRQFGEATYRSQNEGSCCYPAQGLSNWLKPDLKKLKIKTAQ